MPPAVAQAPMLTSWRDCRRTSRMRSASWGVVMEPSTSETSYGPFRDTRVASAKWTMRTESASVSSSSSRFSTVSWQPSHEANFQTASVGRFRLRATSHLTEVDEGPEPVVGEHRSVLAYEERDELAVPAQGHRAFHVALQ